jgi:hypothetical protein
MQLNPNIPSFMSGGTLRRVPPSPPALSRNESVFARGPLPRAAGY